MLPFVDCRYHSGSLRYWLNDNGSLFANNGQRPYRHKRRYTCHYCHNKSAPSIANNDPANRYSHSKGISAIPVANADQDTTSTNADTKTIAFSHSSASHNCPCKHHVRFQRIIYLQPGGAYDSAEHNGCVEEHDADATYRLKRQRDDV